MIKTLTIILISMVALSEPLTTAETYCNMLTVCPSKTSIACKYVANPAIKCTGTVLTVDQTLILNEHNYRRNIVALGKLTGFTQASRMATMKWSTELEQMAKYNAMTCTFDHDTCRNTNRFVTSGQNIYKISSTATITTSEAIKSGMQAFYSEYKNCDMSIIRSYHSATNPVGHFTAMMKWDSDYVGCAATSFKQNGFNNVYLVCNYASTNVLNKPVYIEGTAASDCTTLKNPNYLGLCSVNEKYGHG